jgi:hypothetical protein
VNTKSPHIPTSFGGKNTREINKALGGVGRGREGKGREEDDTYVSGLLPIAIPNLLDGPCALCCALFYSQYIFLRR